MMPLYMQCSSGKTWPSTRLWIMLKYNINEAHVFAMKTDSNVGTQCLKTWFNTSDAFVVTVTTEK